MNKFTFTLLTVLAAGVCTAKSLLNLDDRVIFVGDSITELSAIAPHGYYHQFTNAVKTVYPDSQVEAMALGFSGNTVFSWADHIEPQSRQRAFRTGTGGFDVREAFSKPAGVVVILLGMNDILCPRIRDNEASLQEWKEKYRQLIRAIRERTSPREIVLCEITPLTDDRAAPKNKVRDRMTTLVNQLAADERCRVALTGEAVFQTTEAFRRARQDYLVVPDTVHPRMPLGHTAILKGMLTALQDDKLVAFCEARIAKELADTTENGITYCFKPSPGAPASANARQTHTLLVWLNGQDRASFTLEVPDDLTVIASPLRDQHGGHQFLITGTFNRLQTPVTIIAQAGSETFRKTMQIPASWRVVCGSDNGGAWGAGRAYQPTNSVPFMESELVAGQHFVEPFEKDGKHYPWQLATTCIDYTDGNNPNTLNPYSLTFGSENDALYAVRWIHSEKVRPVQIELSHRTFSATLGFVVWLNGEHVLTADLNRGGKNKAIGQTTLKEGWNCLLVRNDHFSWQRQFSCALLPVDGDSLDALRYSIIPKAGK